MACEDLRSGSIIVVISVPQRGQGFPTLCLDLLAFQSVYSQQRQQEKGTGLATRRDASAELQR